MIDVVIINPLHHATGIANLLDSFGISYRMFSSPDMLYSYNVEVLPMSEWDDNETYKSGIAMAQFGWLDHWASKGQITLCNAESESRKNVYLRSKFNEEGGALFNFVSYKGIHVLLDAFTIKDGGWLPFRNQTWPLFTSGVDSALSFLDCQGIVNGPSQVFMYKDRTMKLKPTPKNFAQGTENKISTKSFTDIWLPLILEDDATDIFTRWAASHGGYKNFKLPDNS